MRHHLNNFGPSDASPAQVPSGLNEAEERRKVLPAAHAVRLERLAGKSVLSSGVHWSHLRWRNSLNGEESEERGANHD